MKKKAKTDGMPFLSFFFFPSFSMRSHYHLPPCPLLLTLTTCQNINVKRIRKYDVKTTTTTTQPREAAPSRACSLSKMRGPDPPSRGACRRRRNMPPGSARRTPLGFLNRSSRGELLVPNKLVGQVKGREPGGAPLDRKIAELLHANKIVFVVSRPSYGWRIKLVRGVAVEWW